MTYFLEKKGELFSTEFVTVKIIINLIIGQFTFVDYSEHAITSGSDSQAVCYIHLKTPDGKDAFGVGKSHNINRASLRAILCAINRAIIAKDGKADH